ncbi:diguanylate cyclase [Sulfurimonas sp. HSL1-2]|uniref:diguanylate cyclase n=1 Tax=Thiomicrolovo zhangzhouensis TaxID=3131933 RepID=UPI0031F8F73D
MYRINREKLQAIIQELDQAMYNHSQWYQNIIRSIVCHLPFDHRDLADDAHRQCTFGQWYYHCSDAEMQQNKTFQSIRTEHWQTHQFVQKLLQASEKNKPVLPIDYDNFANAVERLRLNMQTLKYELEETLYNRDPLTGVSNRISMLSDLRKQMELIERHVETTVIAILDLDHFKQVNDSYGHPMGDTVLSAIAAFILQHLRAYDSIYRYGGEEFLIMMPHSDIDTATAIIERIREGVENVRTRSSGGEPISVTVSAGLTQLREHQSIEAAIQSADKALYDAKLLGRNRVVVASS